MTMNDLCLCRGGGGGFKNDFDINFELIILKQII